MTKLIEKFREWTIKQVDDVLASLPVSVLESQSTRLSLELTLKGIDLSHKYIFTKSANAFHKALLHQYTGGKAKLPEKLKFPDRPIWIEAEGSCLDTGSMKAQGLNMTHHYHPEVVKRVNNRVIHDPLMRKTIERQWHEMPWFIDIVGIDGTVLFTFGLSHEGDFSIGEGHICPRGRCTHEDACMECKAHLVVWGMWTLIALLIIDGNFATTPEPEQYPERKETVRRRVENKEHPKKKKYVEETLTYRVINFDACMKKPAPAQNVDDTEHEVVPRGSWVDQAIEIDPESVIYLDRHIDTTSRTLRHPRYINKRGQTIDVKEHDKRIPVKFKDVITRVVASHY